MSKSTISPRRVKNRGVPLPPPGLSREEFDAAETLADVIRQRPIQHLEIVFKLYSSGCQIEVYGKREDGSYDDVTYSLHYTHAAGLGQR